MDEEEQNNLKKRKHDINGMRIRCGKYFSVVRNNRCSECHKKIRVVEDG